MCIRIQFFIHLWVWTLDFLKKFKIVVAYCIVSFLELLRAEKIPCEWKKNLKQAQQQLVHKYHYVHKEKETVVA